MLKPWSGQNFSRGLTFVFLLSFSFSILSLRRNREKKTQRKMRSLEWLVLFLRPSLFTQPLQDNYVSKIKAGFQIFFLWSWSDLLMQEMEMESKTAVSLCKSEAVWALRGMLCKLCLTSCLVQLSWPWERLDGSLLWEPGKWHWTPSAPFSFQAFALQREGGHLQISQKLFSLLIALKISSHKTAPS